MPFLTRQQRLAFSGGTRLPFPDGSSLDSQDRGELVGGLHRLHSGLVSGVVLDVVTPLIPMPLDVNGNSAHWSFRTMDAALTSTRDNWLALFETEEEWIERVVFPQSAAWSGYLKPNMETRRGLSTSIAPRKMQVKMQAAYQKALQGWQYAFRDDAEHFYDQVVLKTPGYSPATTLYLSMVGLYLRDYIGPFSMHCMLLCGNQNVLDHLGLNSQISTLGFPAPPIVPFSLRQPFAHALMKVLCGKVYLQIRAGDGTMPNAELDTVLEGHLGFEYESTPTSYIHVEQAPWGYSLHTHIEGTPTAFPPIAYDFHVSVPLIPLPTGNGIAVDDLFFYGLEQSYPLAACYISFEYAFAPGITYTLYVRRSDMPEGTVYKRLDLNVEIVLPVLDPALTWQLALFVSGVPGDLPPVAFRGRIWFSDTQGNLSNRAFWSIAGQALQALPFTRFIPLVVPFPPEAVIIDDWYAHVRRAILPIAAVHLRLFQVTSAGLELQLVLARSDDLAGGIDITRAINVEQVLPALPDGVTWQLVMLNFSAAPIPSSVYISGDFWAEDTAGALSTHALWRVIIGLTF
jgi:hypothetical protein